MCVGENWVTTWEFSSFAQYLELLFNRSIWYFTLQCPDSAKTIRTTAIRKSLSYIQDKRLPKWPSLSTSANTNACSPWPTAKLLSDQKVIYHVGIFFPLSAEIYGDRLITADYLPLCASALHRFFYYVLDLPVAGGIAQMTDLMYGQLYSLVPLPSLYGNPPGPAQKWCCQVFRHLSVPLKNFKQL